MQLGQHTCTRGPLYGEHQAVGAAVRMPHMRGAGALHAAGILPGCVQIDATRAAHVYTGAGARRLVKAGREVNSERGAQQLGGGPGGSMGLQHGGQRASPGAPRGRARTRAAGAMEPLLQRNGTPCLEQLLQSRCPEPAVRDLDFVEVFAGDAAVSVGLRAFGYRGISMDVRRDPTHDVLTRTGFIALLEFVLRLRPGGGCSGPRHRGRPGWQPARTARAATSTHGGTHIPSTSSRRTRWS